jgi:hypothetical protein
LKEITCLLYNIFNFKEVMPVNINEISLGRIAVSSLLFNSLTSYNDSLVSLNNYTQGRLEITNPEHRQYLLDWLNDWKCRNLSKGQHKVASDSILEWYLQEGNKLFTDEKPLWALNDNDLEVAANAYGYLKNKTGAWRIHGQSKQEVRIGPTAASKILFAMRPQALMPWDEAMRVGFNCNGDPESYSNYLKIIRNLTYHIENLCKVKGIQIDELPQKLGRPNSTVLALVNEYIWITETRKVELPTSAILARWAELG